MKYVYLHSKNMGDCLWNMEGEMDYLLETVQKVCGNSDGDIKIKSDSDFPKFWYISPQDCSEAVPNNPLSRTMCPNWKVTKCGGFLYEI